MHLVARHADDLDTDLAGWGNHFTSVSRGFRYRVVSMDNFLMVIPLKSCFGQLQPVAFVPVLLIDIDKLSDAASFRPSNGAHEVSPSVRYLPR